MALRPLEQQGNADSRGGTPLPLRFALTDPEAGRVLAVPVMAGSVASGWEEQSTTPARLTRALTPLKARRSLLRETTTTGHHGDGTAPRVERVSRRKLRRWNNDRLANVPLVLNADDEASGMTLREWRPSVFSELQMPENADLRERFVEGSLRVGGRAVAGNKAKASKTAKPFDAMTDAHTRFLRVERRLRSVLARSIEAQHLTPLMEAMEGLLKTFIQCDRLPSLDACPAALHAALEAPVTLERSSASEVLLFPLKPSPFFRLLLHGLAQYYGLKSKSEDVSGVRSVLVSKPRELRDSLSLMPSSTACLPLTTFIRLQQQKHAEERCRRHGGRVLGEREGGVGSYDDLLSRVHLVTV